MSDNSLWFVTFVTHNSRVSERMVEYGIKTGEPVVFTSDDQILIAKKIAEAIEKYQARIAAWNVLPDHVHMVVAAPDMKNLSSLIGKIKGYSAYAFCRELDYEPRQTIWAQKFFRQLIQTEDMLTGIMEYVQYNHLKHAESWGDTLVSIWENHLKAIIEGSCISLDEI